MVPLEKGECASSREGVILIRTPNQGRFVIRFMFIWQSLYPKRIRNIKRTLIDCGNAGFGHIYSLYPCIASQFASKEHRICLKPAVSRDKLPRPTDSPAAETQPSRSFRIASIRFPNIESVAENDSLSGSSSFTLI